MSNINKMTFVVERGEITIRIPVDLLKFAAENHPESPITVKDQDVFAEKVLFQLQHNLGSNESGLSGFEELLDQAMIKVVESGEECADLKDMFYYV